MAISSSSLNVRNMLKASLAVCTLILMSGCASGPQTQTRAALDDIPLPYTARALDDDPIGRLLAQQLRRPSPQMGISPREAMVGEALAHLGIRYQYGGRSPAEGFDCSGLVSYVVAQSLGVSLPRSAADIAASAQNIAANELTPGDLVFFNTMGRKYSHVGIYLGQNRFVHSPSAGGVVRVEDMTMAYWSKRYNGARRIDSPTLTAMKTP